MNNSTTWSKRARCYDAKRTVNGIVLYYECLITGNRRQLKAGSDTLSPSSYIGRTGALVDVGKSTSFSHAIEKTTGNAVFSEGDIFSFGSFYP